MSDNERVDNKSKRKLSDVEASSYTRNSESKQPAYKKRFQPEWLGSLSPFKTWLRPIYDNQNKCKCIACDAILVCGKSELDKHASSKKHQKRVQALPRESSENAAVPPIMIDFQMLPQPSPLDEERSIEITHEEIPMKKERKMSQTHFALSWDSYQSSVCSNFSVLQQNGDFVDLTLAADGHLVKVHQLILGIASPYIKQLIHSASCPHPVIFLNNVSYSTLSSILQYVYTGEVAVTEDELTPFFEAAKALQIQGIDTTDVNTESVRDRNDGRHMRLDSKTGLQTIQLQVHDDKASHYESVSVPMAAKNIKLTNQQSDEVTLDTSSSSIVTANSFKKQTEDPDDTLMMDEDMENEAPDESGDANPVEYFELTHVEDDSPSVYSNTKELQYTVSNRGSLQLILNRYVYNLFSKSKGGVVRRWRCVDYRNHKCPACTITNGNVVVKRTNLHNHPYHDKKILGKISKKAVYSAIKLAEADKDSTGEKS